MALIQCPECNKKVSTNAVACPHCGNPLQKDTFSKPVSPETKQVERQRPNLPRKPHRKETEFDIVIKVKQEITKEEFIRRLMIKLASASETPSDIATASFGTVSEGYKEILSCAAHVESDYSASIGYDREEEYWDKEEKYNFTAQKWEYVDVKKSRTVTDWQPYSGHVSGDTVSMVFNEKSDLSGEEQNLLLGNVFLSIKRENMVADVDTKVSNIALETAKETCKLIVERDASLPGDWHKDVVSTATVEIDQLSCFKFPIYEVDFDYNGQTYHAFGFACNESQITTDIPENTDDITTTAEESVAKYGIAKSLAWVAFIVMFFTSFFLYYVSEIAALFTVFAIITFIIASCLHAKYINRYNDLIKNLKADNMKIKLDKLQETLKERDFDELTPEEIALFDVEAASEEYVSTHKKTGLKLPIIIGSIAVIILLILLMS